MQKYPEKPKELIEIEPSHTISSKKNIGVDEKYGCYRSFIASSAKYLLEEFTESKIISMDLIRSNLFQHLEDMLSDILIDYIDRDLKIFRQKYSLDKKLSDLSPEKAIKLYKKYFEQFKGGDKYWVHMKETYPELKNIFERLTQNFTKSTELLIRRIENDYKFICQAFLSDMDAGVRLTGIKLTDSDLHKDGQQVAILEFTDSKNRSKRLIYKPSPVQSDALIFGDMERLQQYDPNYIKCISMIEAFNKSLEKPLPKYLIAPRKDESGNNIINHYGYMEVVAHNPWHHINFDQIVESILRMTKPGERFMSESSVIKKNITEIIQNKLDEQYAKFLYMAAQENCDFITKDQKDVDQYSLDCGILLGLIQTVGLADVHCENLIVSNKRPMLIDGEICCTFRTLELASTNCFDEDSGSMIGKSASPSFHNCLFDITGKQAVELNHLEKNLFFLNKEGNLIAVSPNPKIFMAGYKMALDIIANSGDVMRWFEQPQVKNMIIRVIPKDTGAFKNQLLQLKGKDFTPLAFEDLRKQSLDEGLFNYSSRSKTINIMKEKSKDYDARINPPPLPHFIIYSEANADTLFNEYRNCCIPQFFTIANGQELLNYKSQIIKHESESYFHKAPLMLMFERVEGIKKGELTEYLMVNAQSICETALNPEVSQRVFTPDISLTSSKSQKDSKDKEDPEEKCLIM